MSETKFTPGEWRVRWNGTIDKYMVQAGKLRTYGPFTHDDAYLIASGKDLYAALEAVEWGCCDDLCVCPACGNEACDGHAADCIIGNAFKKARGENLDPIRRQLAPPPTRQTRLETA